jgi:hypothetical protein
MIVVVASSAIFAYILVDSLQVIDVCVVFHYLAMTAAGIRTRLLLLLATAAALFA